MIQLKKQSHKCNVDNVDDVAEDVKDESGLTVEGLQEFYDEACLAVLNNKYNDGIQWHDVPCYFRSRIICEDSDLQMERVKIQHGVDVSIPDNEVKL